MSKSTIQESAVLDVNDVIESIRQQQRQPKTPVVGQGVAPFGSKEPLAYGFVVEQVGASGPRLRLHYTVAGEGQKVQTEDLIPLKSNQPGFGGTRWWLSCPECRQRRARLYLTPGSAHFACKKCHNLV